jgi:hypothetical protein
VVDHNRESKVIVFRKGRSSKSSAAPKVRRLFLDRLDRSEVFYNAAQVIERPPTVEAQHVVLPNVAVHQPFAVQDVEGTGCAQQSGRGGSPGHRASEESGPVAPGRGRNGD